MEDRQVLHAPWMERAEEVVMVERNHVLVPVTCVECAEQTLPLVRRFLDPASTELTLLQVSEKPPEAAALHQRAHIVHERKTGSVAGSASRAVGEAPTVASSTPSDELRDNNVVNEAVRPARVAESKRQQVAAEYKHILEDLQADGYSATIRIQFGSRPAEQILQAAEVEKIDLIVMTTHAKTGLVRLFSGSVAESMIRNGTIPVLVGSMDSPSASC